MKIKIFLFLLPIFFLPMRSNAEILKKICTFDCAGPMASVTPWHDAQEKAAVFEYRGDLKVCSHPPLVFFDKEAKVLLTIPETPLNPKDPVQSARFTELHEKKEGLLKGLSRGKAAFCPSP